MPGRSCLLVTVLMLASQFSFAVNEHEAREAELISLLAANLACYSYGKYSNNLDSQFITSTHNKLATSLSESLALHQLKLESERLQKTNSDEAKKLLRQNTIKKLSNHILDGIKKSLEEDYMTGGPEALKARVDEVFTNSQYTLPAWLNSCGDLLNYSKLSIKASAMK